MNNAATKSWKTRRQNEQRDNRSRAAIKANLTRALRGLRFTK
mgnify:CR=1 FL=1